MKQKIIFTTIIVLALASQLAIAEAITDTYSTGDTLTATKMDNIKAAVNDNDSRIQANTLDITDIDSRIQANTLDITDLIDITSSVMIADSNDAIGFQGLRGPNNSVVASVSVSVDTKITSFSIKSRLDTDGNARFVIFDTSDSSPVVLTASQPLRGTTVDGWVKSPPFIITLVGGRTYAMGIVSDVDSVSYGDIAPPAVTQGNITVNDANYNTEGTFSDPTLRAGGGGVKIHIRIHGPL